MTAADQHLDVLTILRRTERTWCRQNADESRGPGYLELLADAVRDHLAASDVDAAPSNSDAVDGAQRDALRAIGALEATRRERDDARAERDQRDARIIELTKEVGRLRADLAARDTEREHDRQAVTNVLGERDRLVAELAKKQPHRHVYEWPAPDKPIEPCSCGRPFPRYRQDVEEWGDDIPDIEPWAELLGRVRDELGDWGTPPRNGKGAAR
jgi:hypothetical protein